MDLASYNSCDKIPKIEVLKKLPNIGYYYDVVLWIFLTISPSTCIEPKSSKPVNF